MNDLIRPLPKPPAQVQAFVDILGADLAVSFLLAFGGSEIYIPHDTKGRSQVSALVGEDASKALAENRHRFGRRIPLAKPWVAQMLAARGYNVAEIARQLHVSDVSVRGWLKRGMK